MVLLRPLLFCVGFLLAGCGHDGVPLGSGREVRTAPKHVDEVFIASLPTEDYPFLARFPDLRRVDFFAADGSGGSNPKLRALAAVRFDHLKDVSLLNSPAVTDAGLRHLRGIGSLRMLQLEGTSVTDEGLAFMAKRMRLSGVNVANCPKVGLRGLRELAVSGTLAELGFSAGDLTQAEVEDLIGRFKTITYCGIVDPPGKLDAAALEKAGARKGVQIVVRATGAMQDMGVADP